MAAVAVATAATGCRPESEVLTEFPLVSLADAPVPLSQDNGVALISARVACVIDTYRFQVVCLTPEQTVGEFGREGEGPGEFARPIWLGRVSSGSVGIVDPPQKRYTVFQTDGELVSYLGLPSLFLPKFGGPSSLFGEDLLGRIPRTDGETTDSKVLVEVSAESGEVIWHRHGLEEIAGTECGKVGSGIPTPGGGYVLVACKRELVFLDDRDGASATVVRIPHYVPALPNERDVEGYLRDMASMFGGRSLPQSQMEVYAAGYRADPKGWFLLEGLHFDDSDRLWIATTRDRDDFSYFDIWVGTEFAGTVRIRDRLIGYDILGTTLAALVERKPDDTGVAQRAIDWYDIAGVGIGLEEQ